jgi:hypothetical protein
MNKLQRLVEQAIVDGGAEVILRESSPKGHMKFRIRLPSGGTSLVVTACSPKCEFSTLRSVRRQVEKLCEAKL